MCSCQAPEWETLIHQASRLKGVGGKVLHRYSVNERVCLVEEGDEWRASLYGFSCILQLQTTAAIFLTAGGTQGSIILAYELLSTLLHDVSVDVTAQPQGEAEQQNI